MEIWKEIENSNYYAISNIGNVKRLKHKKWCVLNNSFSIYKEKLLSPTNNNTKKYWRIKINYKNNIGVSESIHRLVAKTFISNPNNLLQVNHIDGNKNNNYVDNLEWITNIDNMKHAWKTGLKKVMYEHKIGAILKREQVLKIPELLKSGYTTIKIAKEYNVSPTTITEIIAGRSWLLMSDDFRKECKNIMYQKTCQYKIDLKINDILETLKNSNIKIKECAIIHNVNYHKLLKHLKKQ